MRRRRLLALAGTAVTTGCVSVGGPADQSRPPSATSRFAGDSCPQLYGETTCYHAADASTDVVLEPAAERVSTPSEPLRFTLRNRGATPVRIVLTFPTFARRVDGRWQRLPHQRQDDGGVAEVASGDTYGLGVVNGSYRDLSGVETTVTERYGAGTFAFAVRLSDPGLTALARVTVDGDPMTLSEPTDVRTSFDGDALTVTHPDEDRRERTITLTFAETPTDEDTLRLAPEVLAGRWDLAAVTLLRRAGVETVTVRTVDNYFRRPVQWLEAAGVWDGPDRVYALGDLRFTVSQERE